MGTASGDREHAHLEICGECGRLFAEYESLKLLVWNSADPDVPSGFANAVMKRIEMDENAFPSDWMQRFADFFEQLMAAPKAQYLALGVGGAVALVNLVRFVFFILIPTTR